MPYKRLMRSRRQKMFAGVCGGFAEYFDVDPVLVRLVWVAFTLPAFPVGVVGYVVCAIVMPEAPIEPAAASAHGAPNAEDTGAPGNAGRAVSASIAMGAGAAAAAASPQSGAHPGMVGGLILVVVGALLLMGNLDLFDWMRWRYIWPSVLIVIGLWMLLRAARSAPA